MALLLSRGPPGRVAGRAQPISRAAVFINAGSAARMVRESRRSGSNSDGESETSIRAAAPRPPLREKSAAHALHSISAAPASRPNCSTSAAAR